MIERELGRIVRVKDREGRKGEMEEKKDKEDILEREGEIRRKWGIGIDEDLTMKERRIRWTIVETARRERAKGKRVVAKNREGWKGLGGGGMRKDRNRQGRRKNERMREVRRER